MGARASYEVIGAAQTVSGSLQTLVWVNALVATSPNVEFMRWWCGEVTDVVTKINRIQLNTQTTSFPNVNGVTPRRLNYADNASNIANGTGGTGTAGVTASGEGTGTKTLLWPDQFNNVNGWMFIPQPDSRYQLSTSAVEGIGLVFPIAVTPLTGWTFGCSFREI